MKEKCIEAVTKAAGRSLTQVELKDIENRISRNRRMLAQTDRANYLAMTPEMQLQSAAELASKEFLAEALKKRQRIALTIEKHDKIDTYLKQQKALHGFTEMESLKRLLAYRSDGKSFSSESAISDSVESRSAAITYDYVRQLQDALTAIQPKIIGLFQNKKATDALVRTLFNEPIPEGLLKGPLAREVKEGAKAWSDTAELARQHFNNAGGQIGRLEDWRMPQNHSQQRVAIAGRDAWVKDMLSWYDPKRYTNDDGSYMTPEEVTRFLKEAWTTIATGGANKVEAGVVRGKGMLANANAERRAIHYKDADSYLAYQDKYGGQDPYTTMLQHIKGLASDIATLEILGPNPDVQFKYWLDTAQKQMALANPKALGKTQAERIQTQNLYDYTSGRTLPIANQAIAHGFDTIRNWLVATRLGSAYITSITDNATMHLTAQVNGLSSMQLMRSQLKTLNPVNREELRIARRAGLSLQTLLGQMNRFGADAFGPTFSGKMANLTVRASFLNAATEARRRAFGVTVYDAIGNILKEKETLAHLDGGDRRLLASNGVNEETFQVWKKAQLEDWGNGTDAVLTPDAIYRIPDDALQGLGNPNALRREAALKLLGLTNDEINMAVPEPGARVKVLTKMGTQRGTWKGELTRSFFLFKSFPLAMIMQHWERAFSYQGNASKAAYLSAFIAGTTILGAAARQIKSLIAGRDPEDMTKGKFWAGALLQGGSLGIYGDFLFQTNTSYGNTPLAILSGPVAAEFEDLIGLTQGNLIELAQGKDTHAGAEAIRVLKSNLPLQNLWYTKAATDRMIFNQLQEMASPGYMRRVEERARRDYNQEFYAKPSEVLPQRAPNFKRALGK